MLNSDVQGSFYQRPSDDRQRISPTTMGQAHITSRDYSQLNASFLNQPQNIGLRSNLGPV